MSLAYKKMKYVPVETVMERLKTSMIQKHLPKQKQIASLDTID